MMKKLKEAAIPHLPYVALIAFINAVLYRDYWTGYRIVSGRDFLFLEVPVVNFQADCLRSGSLALWNPFVNFGFPWVEHYLNTSFSLTHLVLTFIAGSDLVNVQREVFFWILMGGVGVYLCAVELRRSRLSAMIAGICFMFCGQMFMLPSGNFMVCNAGAFPFVLYGYLRSKRRGTPLSLIAIFFLTQFLLGGYIATGMLGLYLLAFYVLIDAAIEKKLALAAKFLAITFVVSFLLALPKLLPLYLGMHSTPRLDGEAGSVPDPFNLISAYDLQGLLIPVKFFFSVYIGLICIVGLSCGIVSAAAKKRVPVDALLVLTLLSGWLLIASPAGELSTLRHLSYHLPFLRLVRVEWLHWYYPSTFGILYCSRFFDGFLTDESRRLRIAAFFLYAVVVTAAFLLGYDRHLHLLAYLITLSLAALWLTIPFFVSPDKRPVLFAALAVLLLGVEFGSLIGRVDVNEPAGWGKESVQIRATDQWWASHSFRDDNTVSKMKMLTFLRDEKRPSVNDSRNWPYLISAINSQWEENLFVDLLNQKRFAGWYNNIQASHEFLRMFYGTDLAAMDNQPLYELLGRKAGGPAGTVSLDKVSCTDFSFTAAPGAPAFLLLNQMFDRRWKAYVDGNEVPLEKANKHFMGVGIPPGRHIVRFVFRDAWFEVSACISLLTLAALGIVVILSRRRSISLPGR